jgi:hypothetical protein
MTRRLRNSEARMPNSVRVIPSQANRIRAAREANPTLHPLELAKRLGIHPNVVGLALDRGDRRRIKSVAK